MLAIFSSPVEGGKSVDNASLPEEVKYHDTN